MEAQIVVDVPTMQTNQPYTYHVAERFETVIEPGMRVIVPFGRGNRQVQGFVIRLMDDDSHQHELKDITDLVDLDAVLTDELLILADWLAKRNFAFSISILQAMLPNVMRAKYHKTMQVVDRKRVMAEPDLLTIFNDFDEVDEEQVSLSKEQLTGIHKLLKQGALKIGYQVQNRARAKRVLAVKPLKTPKELAQLRQILRPNARQQACLLTYLMQAKDEFVPQHLVVEQTGVSQATFKAAQAHGWIDRQMMEEYRLPKLTTPIETTRPLVLNQQQQAAYDQLSGTLGTTTSDTFLLEGITGSGKTEIYLQVMAKAIEQGQTAMMLVPEITLTPQMVRRVKGRFGQTVAVLHSGLSDGERYDEWRRVKRGEAKVVVGARSAVFAPLTNIGVIIIDEEHDASYKQEDNPRYHARDVARWRADWHRATLILGSATPSLESRARAQKGIYQLLQLTERALTSSLPSVSIVDMRTTIKNGGDDLFSPELLAGIQERLTKQEQSVLMLNRRGYANYLNCQACGYKPTCVNCDLVLTLHAAQHELVCHYCGYHIPVPPVCPNCGAPRLRPFGTGTEKAEERLQALFPDARILRMDFDTTRKKGAVDKLLTTFGKGQADILLGTQMIAKGLDFPAVTLVGVLNADTSLALPDFRAAERTFQLLAQVAGRAGRADKPGQVIIQTFNPDHYAIQYAKHHDYEGFYQQEMQLRHTWQYSPFFFTIQLKIGHEKQAEAAKIAYQLADWLKPYLGPQTVMLGPSAGSVARLKNKYYFRIVIKYRDGKTLLPALSELMQTGQELQRQHATLTIDRDPMTFV